MYRLTYITLRNALLFYFLVNVFNGIKITGSANISAIAIAGLVFGILIAMIPWTLKFFKVPVSGATNFLVALIYTFIFLFLVYSGFLGIGSITTSTIRIGLGLSVITLGSVQTMVAATVALALGSFGLDWLSHQKK